MSALMEGGGDGLATLGKRKSPTPDTDTSHTQRGTSQEDEEEDEEEEAGGEEAGQSRSHHDAELPVSKRAKLETATTSLPSQQPERSEEKVEHDARNSHDEQPPIPDENTDTPPNLTEATSSKKEEASETDHRDVHYEAGNEDGGRGGGNGDDGDDDDSDVPPPPKPEPKLCGICSNQPGKYKCPRPGCQLVYCSVACNKIHKENHPPPPPPKPDDQQQPNPDQNPSNNTNTHSGNGSKPDDPYSVLLLHRAEFDRLLLRYPGLERVLNNIQKSTLPPPDDDPSTNANGGVPAKILQQTGGVSGYVPSLVSSRNYYGKSKQQPQIWTGEVGLRRGAEALKKARTDPGHHGDGVREFCELVMYLLNNNPPPKGDGGPHEASSSGAGTTTGLNVTSLVRQEVVADQAKAIQQLLQAEGGGDDL